MKKTITYCGIIAYGDRWNIINDDSKEEFLEKVRKFIKLPKK